MHNMNDECGFVDPCTALYFRDSTLTLHYIIMAIASCLQLLRCNIRKLQISMQVGICMQAEGIAPHLIMIIAS